MWTCRCVDISAKTFELNGRQAEVCGLLFYLSTPIHSPTSVFFPYRSPCLVQVITQNGSGVFKEPARVNKKMREERREKKRRRKRYGLLTVINIVAHCRCEVRGTTAQRQVEGGNPVNSPLTFCILHIRRCMSAHFSENISILNSSVDTVVNFQLLTLRVRIWFDLGLSEEVFTNIEAHKMCVCVC